jgi:hypothetical protein
VVGARDYALGEAWLLSSALIRLFLPFSRFEKHQFLNVVLTLYPGLEPVLGSPLAV